MTEDQTQQQIREALTVGVLANVAEAVLDRALNEARGYIVEALLASLASASGARTWQPMESAPKDGTRILVYREGQIYVAAWMTRPWNCWGVAVQRVPGEWGTFTDIGPLGFGKYVRAQGPTAWMPLPDPPEAVPSSGERQET